MPTISNEINNVVYVEPNFNYSQSEYDTNGLNTYELTPPAEDYCVYANLEVEFSGRKIVASNSDNPTKIAASWYSSNGTTQTNFMKGTTMPDGTNYFTTNYTDTFLGDIKKNGASTEMFGIKNIDIEYGGYMQAVVTIEFVDIRGVSLFAQKEYYETSLNANPDSAINADEENVADSFFSAFFKIPQPKFTLYVKGFYGQPVSYQLMCNDFRARFESSTGSFNCTAKFVGYQFAFMNDAMMNIIMVAPYSDYIGSDYWAAQSFTVVGDNGGKVAMPKFAELVANLKAAKAQAEKLTTSAPEVQIKNELDSKVEVLTELRKQYAIYVGQIIGGAEQIYMKEEVKNKDKLPYVLFENDNQGNMCRGVIFSNIGNRKYEKWCDRKITDSYNLFKNKLDEYNQKFSEYALPTPPNFGDVNAQEFVDVTDGIWVVNKSSSVVSSIQEASNDLYNKLLGEVSNGNKTKPNGYGDFQYIFYYNDNGFCDKIDEYTKNIDEDVRKANEAVDKLTNKLVSQALGWKPSVENLTRIVMAHFETYAYMLHKCGIDITEENRTATSLGLVPEDLPDVNLALSQEIVPPFPLVTELKEIDGSRKRSESWVGNYSGYFREKDLVNGIINAIAQMANELGAIEGVSGEELIDGLSGGTSHTCKVKIPLTVYDLVTTQPIYDPSLNTNDVISTLSTVAMRAIGIFGLAHGDTTNNGLLFKLGDGKAIGRAEAVNFTSQFTLSKDVKNKMEGFNGNVESLINIMKGIDTGTYQKPWPWNTNSNSNSGLITNEGYLNIGKVRDNDNMYTVPITNLSWKKIIPDLKSKDAAARSNDFINTRLNAVSQLKQNLFSVEFNVNKISSIIENQLTGIEGLGDLRDKLLDESKYSENKYGDYFNNLNKYVVHDIENAGELESDNDTCLLPVSKNLAKSGIKYFDSTYNVLDNIHKDEPGFKYKDGSKAKRKSDGWSDYLKNPMSDNLTVCMYPAVNYDMSPNSGLTLFASYLYYQQTDVYIKALMFLGGLGAFIDYEKIFEDFGNDNVNIMNIPLPGLLYAGGVLWAFNEFFHDTDKMEKRINGYLTPFKENGHFHKLYKLLNGIPSTRETKEGIIRYFTTWVSGNKMDWANPTLIKPFSSWYEGLEISPSDDSTMLDFLISKPEGNLKDGASWFTKKDVNGGDSLVYFLATHFTDNLFRNYYTLGTEKNTNGFMLGNRDGGPSVVAANGSILTPCTFIKHNKYFTRSAYTSNGVRYDKPSTINLNTAYLSNFFEGFFEVVLEGHTIDEERSDSSVAQGAADTTHTNDDIRVGIYRYSKLIYDRWIGGLTDERFDKNYTQHAFFDDPDKYFVFIDTFYVMANNVYMDIDHFKNEILEGFRESQYSLLSFLSNQYSKNKFQFNCLSNFYDIKDVSNIKKMFDLVPYTGTWDVKEHPNFVVMYCDEPSAHLDIPNGDYPDDSFLLSDTSPLGMTKWPEPLKSNNLSNYEHYKIPAFGVTYGKLYQSYFTNIDVSMDNPMVTEQSARIQFQISSSMANDTGSEENTGDRQEMMFYGQDLYSVYSNHSYTCTVTMLGCAYIQPMMYFCLNNIPMFRGTYIIKKVQHSISPGNMTTKFIGVRMARTSTRSVEDYAIRKGVNNNGIGSENGSSVDVLSNENRIASLDNNCPYKVFPLVSNDPKSAFEQFKRSLKKHEGGYANVKGDPGGCTMQGVTIATYKQYYGEDKNCEQLKNIPDEHWDRIVKVFWDDWQADKISNASIACLLVDWHYMSGGYGIIYPQQVLKVNTGTSSANVTAAVDAINAYPNQQELFNKLWDRRKKHLEAIANKNEDQKKFLDGWLSRLKDFTFDNNNTVKLANNNDGHVDPIVVGFINAVDKTSKSSGVNVGIGYDSSKSNGNVVYITNADKSTNFGMIFDILLYAYSDKLDEIRWIVPTNSSQEQVPAGFICKVNEASKETQIYVVSEGNTGDAQPISAEEMNPHFCKAIIKKYGSWSDSLKKTIHDFSDGSTLFSKYKIDACDTALKNAGLAPNGVGGVIDGKGYIGNWNVNLFLQKLHYWQSNICEKGDGYNPQKTKRSSYGGCGRCTGVVNRALRDSGFGNKYWNTYPWEVCAKMSDSSSSDFVVIDSKTGGTDVTISKQEFPITTQSQAGDICTMWSEDKKTHFHTCAYDGKQWVSDFNQNSCNVYRNSSKVCNMIWYIFRHKKPE